MVNNKRNIRNSFWSAVKLVNRIQNIVSKREISDISKQTLCHKQVNDGIFN